MVVPLAVVCGVVAVMVMAVTEEGVVMVVVLVEPVVSALPPESPSPNWSSSDWG